MQATDSQGSNDSGPFLVCGLGQLGHCIVGLLRQMGHPVVCLTLASRPDWLRAAEASGVRVVLGDARDEAALRACGLLEARALIAATDHDAINIEAALTAKGIRPDLPIVVRVGDRAVAPQLEAALGVRKVLAMSAMAAPVFAAGVLADRAIAAFDLADDLFVVGGIPPGSDSPLGAADPISLVRTHGLSLLRKRSFGSLSSGTIEALSAPDSAGSAMFLAKAANWRKVMNAGAPGGEPSQPRMHWPRPGPAFAAVGRVMSQLRAGASALARPAFVATAALVALTFVVFQVGMGLTFVDALYFITTTITTTGYGDISLVSHPDPFKLYAVGLMIVGSAGMGVLYSWMTGFVVAERFRQLLGGHRVSDRDHVIVAGLSSGRIRDLRRAAAQRTAGGGGRSGLQR